MITVLTQIEHQLPTLLTQKEIWHSLDINYHPPRVERLWCSLGEYRINLHRIYPCQPGEAYLHPHPWPSAMHVLSGSYEMIRGYGEGIEKPIILGTTILTAGSIYTMENPNEWHTVRPLGGIALSLMISGKPWNRAMPIEKSSKDLPELSAATQQEIIDTFLSFYT